MKILISILMLLNFSIASAKEEAGLCSILFYSGVKKTVEAHGDHDKFKHCAVSCLLALRCSAAEVRRLGVLKEGLDLIGSGNAEMADIRADFQGVQFVTSKKAKTDQQCISMCQYNFGMACQ